MIQGHFTVGNHAQIETHTQLNQKMSGPNGIAYIGAPQAPSHELNSAKQI